MVARLLWEQDAAGSNPVTSTRLSLDAGCVSGSAFSFVYSSYLSGYPIYQHFPIEKHNMVGVELSCCAFLFFNEVSINQWRISDTIWMKAFN